jgi:hypothetical protein
VSASANASGVRHFRQVEEIIFLPQIMRPTHFSIFPLIAARVGRGGLEPPSSWAVACHRGINLATIDGVDMSVMLTFRR